MNTNYDLVIESFISYCDNMMIAEEASNDGKMIFNQIMNTIKTTEKLISQEHDPQKQKKMYGHLLRDIARMKRKLLMPSLRNNFGKLFKGTLPYENNLLQQVTDQEIRIENIFYGRAPLKQHDEEDKEQTKRIEKALRNIKSTSLPKNKDALVNLIHRETVIFLKKYVSTPDFKSRYKPYLHMIKIEPTYDGEICSIQFTEYQNGTDYSIKDPLIQDNVDWYDEVMEVGKAFIKRRFGITANTGDGDEGTLYID